MGSRSRSSNLDFGFARRVSIEQFVLAVGATHFLLATGNRIVRFTLDATKASLVAGEGTLRGGRLLGPMEPSDPSQPGVDEITEYFLVGTFASVLLAAAAGVLVLAAA